MDINNIVPEAQRIKAQLSNMRNFIFSISEKLHNFRNELFDLVKAQRNSAIAEWYFRTKLKCNLTSSIEILQHNSKTAFFCDFRQKKNTVNNLLKKADIYQYSDRNGTKLSWMYLEWRY